jgi:hypothetical protein
VQGFADPANWQATHRLAGILIIVSGIAVLAVAALLHIGW